MRSAIAMSRGTFASSSAASSILAGRERRLGRLQGLLAGRGHQLREEFAHLRLGYGAHELRDGAPVLEAR